MFEQLKSKTQTPDFFTEEEKHYAETRIEALTKNAGLELQRKQQQDGMQKDMLREDAQAYQSEYLEQQNQKYEQYCSQKTAEIDANPKYSWFKKRKEKKKLTKGRDAFIGEMPEMISEARM